MGEFCTNGYLTIATSTPKSDVERFLDFENNEGNAVFPQGN